MSEDPLAAGYVKASAFNKTGLHHSAGDSGIKVTKTRNDKPITTYDAGHHPIGSVALNDGPQGSAIRIATLEDLSIGGKKLFRVWPGGASHQGWIELDDVKTESPVKEEQSARAGNGALCGAHGASALTTSSGHSATYIVTPKSIQGTGNTSTRWKIQSSTGAWFLFDPDWDNPGGLDRVFLMWSWTPSDAEGHNSGFAGGGVVRTEMLANSTFTPCKVQPVRTVLRETNVTSGSNPHSNARKLSAYAAYGKVTGPTQSFYGWTIVASRPEGGACQMHVACTGGPAACPLVPLPKDCKF